MKFKRINQIFMVVICAVLLLAPCITYAEETEPTPSPSETPGTTTEPTPSASPSETPETEEPEPSPSETPETEETEPTPSPSETPEKEEVKITLNKTTVTLKVGDPETIKATVSGSEESVVWSSNDDDIVSVKDGKLTANKVGEAIITAKIGDTSATCKVTVEAVKVEVVKGTDATLKDVTISNGTLDQSFKSNVYQYSVTVDSDVTKLNIKPELTDKKASYKTAHPSKFKDGAVVKIIVTSEDEKKTNTYEFKIVKDSVKLGLKSLKINGYALNEEFDNEKLNYTADIPNEIDTISIEATPEDGNKVTIKGGTNLKVGGNTVRVTVKDDDGNSKVYEIIVTRSEESEVEENPTSIITSSNINTSPDKNNGTHTPNSTSGGDNFLKYFIVSLACLILFAIGGIGIYFYIQTSPRKLKKELVKMKQSNEVNQVEENPIVVVEEPQKTNIVLDDNIEVMPSEEPEITKEYKIEELNPNNNSDKLENLFDDSEDV